VSECCGIGIGSNQGDRLENLRRGVERLLERLPTAQLLAVGPLFETAPVDCAPGTQAFLNSVILLECDLPPHALREITAEVECWMGRPAEREKNAPRTLDLDLLFFGDRQIDDAVLTLPHPRLAQRRFVLEPLAAVCGQRVLPGQQRSIAELLAQLPTDQGVVKLGDEWVIGL
jgi:2-amino-4-hydroxy-6-hydroxymethyldihydropteridine diphosphokinase